MVVSLGRVVLEIFEICVEFPLRKLGYVPLVASSKRVLPKIFGTLVP
jgi:hypothetical protein